MKRNAVQLPIVTRADQFKFNCGLCRRFSGLYDPVLDDTEAIYFPIDPEDLGIVNIQTDVEQKTETFESHQTDSATLVKPVDKLVIQPDVERLPLLVNLDEIPPEGKYKLPVSEQYDPEGKRVRLCKINGKKVVRFDLKEIINEEIEERAKYERTQDAVKDIIESKISQEQDVTEDILTIGIAKETDLKVIKERALEIVSDSIERAVSVAEEAKENVKNEFLSEQNDLIESKVTKDIIKTFEEESQQVNIRKESVKEISDVNVSEEVKKFEKIDTQSRESVEERKLRTKQDISETIESGTVSKRAEVFRNENIEINEPIKMEKSSVISKIFKKDECNKDSEAERRVFSIGLQTIPNIKEKVDTIQVDSRLKLLTTFFLQLTNIMVALSKIILTQPLPTTTIKIGDMVDRSYTPRKEEIKEEREFDTSKKKFEIYNHEEGQGLSKYKYDYDSHVSEGELIRKGKLSGAKIAQIEGGKPPELTDKMDIVISEFQKRTGCEEQSHGEFDQVFRTRSGSRSKIKDEDSFYSESHKKTETGNRNLFEEFSETKSQSHEMREMKSEKRTFESTTTDTKPFLYATVEGRNLTYLAIVEAHVYTNKDAIFEEMIKRDSQIKSEETEKRSVDIETLIKETQNLYNIADTVIIPQTDEISISEINNEKIELKNIEIGIEDSSIKVAAKKISEVIEPLVKLSDRLYSAKEARTIVEPFKSIVQNTDVSAEEFQQYFVATTVVSQKIYPSLEQPTTTVVEITEITTDEKENQDVQVAKVFEQKPKIEIEDARSIAETIEISLNENRSDLVEGNKMKLESAKLNINEKVASEVLEVSVQESITEIKNVEAPRRESRMFSENTFLTIAEQTTIPIQEPKQETLPLIKTVTEQAKVDVNKNVATEIFEVSVIEQKEESLNLPKVRMEIPKLSIEESAYSVAQKSTISPVETRTDIEIFKATEENAKTKFLELKAVEKSLVDFQEPKHEVFETPEKVEKYPVPSVERSYLTVAEKSFTLHQDVVENIIAVPTKTEYVHIGIDELEAIETNIISLSESHNEGLQMPELSKREAQITMSSPPLTVVEITTILPQEPKDESLDIPKTTQCTPSVNIVEKRAVETVIVFSEEPESNNLDVTKIAEKQPGTVIEESSLTLAEVQSIFPEEPRGEIIIPDLENQQADIIILDFKAAETIIVEPEESKQKEIFSKEPTGILPNLLVERPSLIVAEVTSMLPEETKGVLNVPEIRNQEANLKILEFNAAETTVVEVEETKQQLLKTEQLRLQQPKPNIELSNLSVAEVLATTTIDSSQNMSNIVDVNKILRQDQRILMEGVPLTVAATTAIVPSGPKDELLKIPKVTECKPSSDIIGIKAAEIIMVQPEEPKCTPLKIARIEEYKPSIDIVETKPMQTTLVQSLEPNFIKLKIEKVEEKESKTSIEGPYLTIAEVKTMLPEEHKAPFYVPKITEQKADVKILELKAADTIVVQTEESKQRDFNLQRLNQQQTMKKVEPSNLSVAETSTILPHESKNELGVKVIQNQKAKIGVLEIKAAEVRVTSSEEAKELQFKLKTQEEKKPKRVIEPSLSVAEVSATITNEISKNILEVNKMKNQKASYTFGEHKAIETEQTFDDLSCKTLTLVAPEEKQIKMKIEEVQSIAQVTEVNVNEAERKLLREKDERREATLILKAIKPIEQESVISFEALEKDQIQKSKIISNRANVTMVESNSSSIQEVVAVAEAKKENFKFVGTDVQANLAIEKSKRAEASIQEVNIQEALIERNKYSTEYVKDIELDTKVSQSQQSLQKHESHAVLKSRELQASSESNYKSETEELKVKKSKSKAAVKEVDVKIREISKRSESVSPSSPLSPITPVIEEYVFSLDAELEHPYVIGAAVSEEALLRIKAQRNTIESADTSYTLAIESTIEGDSEDIEEIEEIENVHLSKELITGTREHIIDTSRSLKSTSSSAVMDSSSYEGTVTESVSFDVNQKMLLQQAGMQVESLSSEATLKLSKSGAYESSKASKVNSLTMGVTQDLSNEALSNEASFKLSLKKAMAKDESIKCQSKYEAQQSSQIVAGLSSEMDLSLKSHELSAEAIGLEESYKLSLKKALAKGESMKSQSNYEAKQSSQIVSGLSSEMDLSLKSHELSAESTGLEESYKLSIQQKAMMEDETKSSQSKSESSSHRTRKTKSSKSKRAQEQDASLQIVQSRASEASMEGQLEYTTASSAKQSSYSSESMESSAMRNLKSEIYEQERNSGSYVADLHMAAGSKSSEMSAKSAATEYSATVIKDVSNTALKENLRLQMDMADAITNGVLPSPLNVPPTPLTDEYIFRLESELYEDPPFVQRDCSISPDSMHEEMVLNGLIAHYRTIVEGRVLYSPPLPTPPTSPDKTKPIYSKPGLKGGGIMWDVDLPKEAKLELQRSKNLLLAIDRTLKEIEEYKASVGLTSEKDINKMDKENKEDTRLEDKVDKELAPMYVVEEWGEDAEEIKEDDNDSIKITIVTEDTIEGETVTITAEREREMGEREEASSDFEDIPLAGTVEREVEITVQRDSDESQDITDNIKELIIGGSSDGVVSKQIESDLSDTKVERTTDVEEIKTSCDNKNIGITQRSHLQNKERLLDEETKWTTLLQTKIKMAPNEQIYNIEEEYSDIGKAEDRIGEKSELRTDMAQKNLAEQLVKNIETTIDVNAPTEQQLQQLREQLAALSQLPSVIQQTVQRVNEKINIISQMEQQKRVQQLRTKAQPLEIKITRPTLTEEDLAIVKREEVKRILDSKMREEKLKREYGLTRIDQQSRQVTQRSSPRVNNPSSFGRLQEQSRILSRRKWRPTDEVYDEDMINETLLGQAEVIKGRAMGVNFMKFVKPPPPLDHLKHSEVFKAIQEQQ